MSTQDDTRKRAQTNSPEKQTGTRAHDRKRQHVSTGNQSDMEESEPEAEKLTSPAPLTVPPPTEINAQDSREWNQDREGDTTMVDSSPTGSPLPPSPTPERREDVAQGTTVGSNSAGEREYPWIVRRTMRVAQSRARDGPDAGPAPPQGLGTDNDIGAQYAGEGQAMNNPGNPNQPPRLPRDLERTLTPIGGFPTIHLSTPPWYNLLPEQKLHFAQYPEPKAWIRDWQASKEADLVATSESLKGLILKMTGERAKLSSPQQEKAIKTNRKADRQKPPYHFLVTGLSERAHRVIMANPIISTKDASAFIIPYTPPVPRFLCSIEGFTLSIKDATAVHKAELEAMRIVRETLRGNETFVTLLKGRLGNDETSQHNLEPALAIIGAIDVKLAAGEEAIVRTTRFGTKKPTWNVYFAQTPPIDWADYFAVLMATQNMTFVDMDYGLASPVSEDNRLHCFNCKGADHDQPNCEYAKLEGWFHSTAANEKIEETAEFASSSKHARGGGGTDRRRGFPRGRGRGFGGRIMNNNDRY
ncbi:hypothetical protein C0992_001894 [Termitomyces sp. T32_za158]|nr:hypothetical protein C0992_001894 [Termitomyces sp. T32_za158]